MAAAQKIVFYGGSFDPPHLAHRALVQAALAAIEPDRLLIMPTGDASSYKKRALTAGAHRLAMCELAFGDLPQVEISQLELASQGPNYTIDSLESLEKTLSQDAAQPPQWYLLLGADQLAKISVWQRWRDLLAKVSIVLADRAGLDAQTRAQSRHNIALCRELGCSVIELPLQAQALSATAIRQRLTASALRSADADWSALLAPEVLRYIAEHSLYSS